MKEKKSNQRIVLQRERETWRKERRETVRERFMGRGETRVSDGEGVRREKMRKLTTREREGAKKLCFP